MSIDEGAVLMPAPSHGSRPKAKGLKKLAKLSLRLTPVEPAARTARASVVDIDRRGLNGLRRGGRAVEGGGLLNRYTGITRIEGSNPFLSATLLRAARYAGPALRSFSGGGGSPP